MLSFNEVSEKVGDSKDVALIVEVDGVRKYPTRVDQDVVVDLDTVGKGTPMNWQWFRQAIGDEFFVIDAATDAAYNPAGYAIEENTFGDISTVVLLTD